jgi:hypothetical protein
MIRTKNIKHIILAIPLLSLVGCFQDIDANGNPGFLTPRPMFLSNLPRGDDSFSIGFREGCYNFIGQTGYGIMRMFDKPENAEIHQGDKLYLEGYRNGDRYCSVYVNKNMDL